MTYCTMSRHSTMELHLFLSFSLSLFLSLSLSLSLSSLTGGLDLNTFCKSTFLFLFKGDSIFFSTGCISIRDIAISEKEMVAQ